MVTAATVMVMVVVVMVTAATVVIMVVVVMVTAAAIVSVVMVVMMGAGGIGIEVQTAGKEQLYSLVRVAGNTAEDSDVRVLQSEPGTGTDAAADQHINSQLLQQTCQSAMAAAVGIHYLRGKNLALFGFVNFERGGVTEMLEHIACFVSDCDLHIKDSFCLIYNAIISPFWQTVNTVPVDSVCRRLPRICFIWVYCACPVQWPVK